MIKRKKRIGWSQKCRHPWRHRTMEDFMKKAYVLLFFGIIIISSAFSQNSFQEEKQAFLDLVARTKNSLKITQTYNSGLLEAVDKQNITEVERLLKSGADPNGIGNEGAISPLGYACNKGNIDIVKLLLEYGADPNFIPKGQMSALGYATFGTEKPDIVKYLIFAGVDINYHEPDSLPAIYYTVLLGHSNTTKILLDAGANINFKDKNGFSPTSIAQRVGWKNCYEILTKGSTNLDMKKLIEISPDKLARNLVDISSNNLYEPFWNNEVIVLPRGYLEIIDVNKTMWGTNRYLVAINGTLSSLKPFYIETKRTLRSMRVEYNNLIFEDLRIRKSNYSTYQDGRVEKETFLFIIEGER
jgi:ankyrin repeat protein